MTNPFFTPFAPAVQSPLDDILGALSPGEAGGRSSTSPSTSAPTGRSSPSMQTALGYGAGFVGGPIGGVVGGMIGQELDRMAANQAVAALDLGRLGIQPVELDLIDRFVGNLPAVGTIARELDLVNTVPTLNEMLGPFGTPQGALVGIDRTEMGTMAGSPTVTDTWGGPVAGGFTSPEVGGMADPSSGGMPGGAVGGVAGSPGVAGADEPGGAPSGMYRQGGRLMGAFANGGRARRRQQAAAPPRLSRVDGQDPSRDVAALMADLDRIRNSSGRVAHGALGTRTPAISNWLDSWGHGLAGAYDTQNKYGIGPAEIKDGLRLMFMDALPKGPSYSEHDLATGVLDQALSHPGIDRRAQESMRGEWAGREYLPPVESLMSRMPGGDGTPVEPRVSWAMADGGDVPMGAFNPRTGFRRNTPDEPKGAFSALSRAAAEYLRDTARHWSEPVPVDDDSLEARILRLGIPGKETPAPTRLDAAMLGGFGGVMAGPGKTGLHRAPRPQYTTSMGAADQFPIEAYHATPIGNLTKFSPGSHFGTAKAANDRIEHVMDLPPGSRGPTFPDNPTWNIIPVRLRVEKPIELEDLGEWWDADIYTQLFERGIINAKQLAKAEQGAMPDAIKFLRNLGHDAVRYVNAMEDPGSISYMMLDPSRIRSRFAAFDPKELASADLMKRNGGPVLDASIPGRVDGGAFGAVEPGSYVPPGSFIFPADTPAALGEGNSEVGQEMLMGAFGAVPIHGPGTGRSDSVGAFTDGGQIALSAGEMMVPPDRVQQAGGHDRLRRVVTDVRRKYRKKLESLPAPRR